MIGFRVIQEQRLRNLVIIFLLTNFSNYIAKFAKRFDCEIRGQGGPMQTATNKNGLSIINFGIGSANAATIMDLLTACNPKGVLFLGKCGGLKQSAEIGRYIIPIAAIRGEGTSNDYLPPEVPALPSFKLHKFVSDTLLDYGQEYRTGVIYTTNRRVWEWDNKFRKRLIELSAIGIDMETATLFIVGHANKIARGVNSCLFQICRCFRKVLKHRKWIKKLRLNMWICTSKWVSRR